MRYYLLTAILLGALYIFASPAPSEKGFMFMADNSLPEAARYVFFLIFSASVLLTQYAAGKSMDESKAFFFSVLLICPFFIIPGLFVEQPMALVSLFFAGLSAVAFIHMPIAATLTIFLSLWASPLSLLLLAIPIKKYLESKSLMELVPLLGATGLIFSYPSFTPSLAGVPLAAYGLSGFTSLFGAGFALLCFIFPSSAPALALFQIEYKQRNSNAALGALGLFLLMAGQGALGMAAISALIFFLVIRFLPLDPVYLFFLYSFFTTAVLAGSPSLAGVDVPEHELLELFARYKPDMIAAYPGAYRFYAHKEPIVVDLTEPPRAGSIVISVESLRKAGPRNVLFLLGEDSANKIRYYYNERYIYVLQYAGGPLSDADVFTAGGRAYVGRASLTKLLLLFNGEVLVDASGFEQSAIMKIANSQPIACEEHACLYSFTT